VCEHVHNTNKLAGIFTFIAMAGDDDEDYADDIPHFLEEFYQAREENYNCTFRVEEKV